MITDDHDSQLVEKERPFLVVFLAVDVTTPIDLDGKKKLGTIKINYEMEQRFLTQEPVPSHLIAPQEHLPKVNFGRGLTPP